MAEKDADDNPLKNTDNSKPIQRQANERNEVHNMLDTDNKKEENQNFDLDPYLPSYESSLRKEENPFSFKKFLHQDSSAQKNKGARKKVYTPLNAPTSNKINFSNHDINNDQSDNNSRVVNTSDVSSVLPDFVQDHLVIEQCYLSGTSVIDIDNLNLQNLPDLNLEHGSVHFNLKADNAISHSNQNNSDHLLSNLPDFTLSARHLESSTQNKPFNKGQPDFNLKMGADVAALITDTENTNNLKHNSSRIKLGTNSGSETSQSVRHRAQISSSPSVPLDLPSYENSESNQNLTIPFDLTIPAEEKNSINRGMASTETVSKSLPDFLSDGPIKKEINENLQNGRGNFSTIQNGLPHELSSALPDHERLVREVELLRRQISEKNRQIIFLESELEHLHSTDKRETANLECALKEVEKNLKQTAKRAMNAEEMVVRLKQENKVLKSEISSLKSENVQLRLGNYTSETSKTQESRNHQIAKELHTAANIAENSLRSLLSGIENLRIIASSMENSHKFQDSNEEYQEFLQEDSASGPAL